jgi:hypothetical protein
VSLEIRTDTKAFRRFLARDLVLVGAAIGTVCWDARLLDAHATNRLALAVGVAAGVLFALASFLAHEWGHWLGAVLTGGIVHPPKALTSFFLFFFDTGKSTRRQFLAMSYGGYLATLGALGLLAAWVRSDTPSGRTALLLAGVGMTITAALEIPETWRVARGGPLPSGLVFVGPESKG